MTETRLGRQTPTQSVTIPYSKTRGQEAAELYAKTDSCDSAVKYGYEDSRKDRLSHFYHLPSLL